jgi:hypothetical protein
MVFAENRSTMRAGIGLHAAPCIAVVMLLLLMPRAIAEDAAPAATSEVAKPSVEELATPTEVQKTAENGRDTDTREAMCLMIESAARANGLPLEFFARVIWQKAAFSPMPWDRLRAAASAPRALRNSCRAPPVSGACSTPSIRSRRYRNPRSS